MPRRVHRGIYGTGAVEGKAMIYGCLLFLRLGLGDRWFEDRNISRFGGDDWLRRYLLC